MILEIIQAPIASWARGCQTMGPAGFRVEGFGKSGSVIWVQDFGFWDCMCHVWAWEYVGLFSTLPSCRIQQVPKLRTPA